MSEPKSQDERIEAIIGDDEADFDACVAKFYDHLKASLQLPCDVTGIQDFRWEGYYVIGPGDHKEYARLRKDQPSFKDVFELLAVVADVHSDWMMFRGKDLGAHVRRKSDGKEFGLGLVELEAVDKKSKNFQLLNDYSEWFVNNR